MNVALAFVAFATALTASCSTAIEQPADKNTEVQKKPIEGPELIGRIASVPAGKSFVLIQRYGQWQSTAGQILTTRGADERSANLRITGESLGEFTAADVQSGNLEIGDGVYSVHIPAPVPAEAPASDLEAAANSPIEKVQKNN